MTQPHYIDREAVALWGCADGNGVDPRLVFLDKATADQVAADTDMVVRPLYTERPAPMEAVAWREAREIIQIATGDDGCYLTLAEADRILQALAVIPTQGGEQSSGNTGELNTEGKG